MHSVSITTQIPFKLHNCNYSFSVICLKTVFTEKEPDVVNKLTRVPLSNTAVLKHTSDMAINACEQLVLKSIQSDYFVP